MKLARLVEGDPAWVDVVKRLSSGSWDGDADALRCILTGTEVVEVFRPHLTWRWQSLYCSGGNVSRITPLEWPERPSEGLSHAILTLYGHRWRAPLRPAVAVTSVGRTMLATPLYVIDEGAKMVMVGVGDSILLDGEELRDVTERLKLLT